MQWPDVVVDMGEYQLSFEANLPLGTYFEEKALKELRETPELRESALEKLKTIIKERGELHLVMDDNKILMAFLRCCKFYEESAYNKMVNYYKFTIKHPKIYADLLPSNEEKVIRGNILQILPNRDKEGRRILIIRAGSPWNVKEVNVNELIRAIMLLIMAGIIEDRTQVAGCTVILDLEGMSISHAWQFSPGIAKMLLDFVQECLPCRVKAVHIIYNPSICNIIYNIFKPFLQEKLRNRIIFHGSDVSRVIEEIGAKNFPIHYGGEMNIDFTHGDKIFEIVKNFDDFYKIANENKYVPPAKNKK